MRFATISAVVLMTLAAAFAAGCQGPVTNSVTVESATPDEVVLLVTARAGSKVWIVIGPNGGGSYKVLDKDSTTRVTYKRLPSGYSVGGEGLGSVEDHSATNVVFVKPVVEADGRVEIGTYTAMSNLEFSVPVVGTDGRTEGYQKTMGLAGQKITFRLVGREPQ
jgi:hypothetical protein